MAEGFSAFKGNRATWTVAIVAGGGIFVYMWWKKHQQQQQAAATAAAGYGYGYGAGYGVSPIVGYGFGGTGLGFPFNPSGYGYGVGGSPTPTTNSQWFQSALAFLTQNGTDAMTAEAALAKYLAGQPVSGDQALIIQIAEGAIGPPPQNGPNGFPPNINTSGQQGGGGGNAQNPVTGLHVTQPGTTGVDVAWNPSSGATSYKVTSSKGNPQLTGPTSARIHSINPVGHPTSATVSVLAEPAAATARAATLNVQTH